MRAVGHELWLMRQEKYVFAHGFLSHKNTRTYD